MEIKLSPKMLESRPEKILTNSGWKDRMEVGPKDFSPNVTEGKAARLRRGMIILLIPNIQTVEEIHEYERKKHMTRFFILSEFEAITGHYIQKPPWSDSFTDLYFDEIKKFRPSSYRMEYGRYGWEGSLDFHHQWDIAIFTNKSMLDKIVFKTAKKQSARDIVGEN